MACYFAVYAIALSWETNFIIKNTEFMYEKHFVNDSYDLELMASFDISLYIS
jgi:hypothetical protein